MSAHNLAEAIILQSIEDLYDMNFRSESIDFFSSTDFIRYASEAHISNEKRIELLDLIRKIIINTKYDRSIKNSTAFAGRANSSPLALSAPPSRP